MDISIEMRNKHFICRVAAIIIIENQLLMVKNRDFPCYYTIGGKVKIGESTDHAILREIQEETGLCYEIENLSFVHERFYDFNNITHHEIIFYYRVKENILTKNLARRYTDQGEREMMVLLDINTLQDVDIIPAFFKDIQLNQSNRLKHLVTREGQHASMG